MNKQNFSIAIPLTILAIFFGILIGYLLFNKSEVSGNKIYSDFESTDLQVGKYYKRAHKLDDDDPFSKPIIDTFLILDKKDGYVKFTKKEWCEKDSIKFWSSANEKYFSRSCQLITQ